MLNELNKHSGFGPGGAPAAAGLPGYDQYLPHDDYDVEDAWNKDRYYNGSGGQRYKVSYRLVRGCFSTLFFTEVVGMMVLI